MYKDISDVFIQFAVFTFYPKHMGYCDFSNDVDNFFCLFFVSRKKISSVLRVLEYMLLKLYEKLNCKPKISYINRMKLKIFDNS